MVSDLISRQAAIRWVKIECNPYGNPTLDYDSGIKVIEHLKQMPAAEPELDEWCTDCKEYDQERHCCPRWNRVIRNTLKDVERKPGRWLMHSDFPDRLICSECGAQFDVWHWESEQMHFCPNCGKGMRGIENETD